MKKVIAVFDIGKTNKKIFLFDSHFSVVYSHETRFDEVTDDDGYPCDDIAAIEQWLQNTVRTIQLEKVFEIKAINFSTHGATLVYLDRSGHRVTPLYNYLKPLPIDFTTLYDANDGVEEFSRRTASPAYGMLNAGLQIYWLKKCKPHFWSRVATILHYPQYLSYLFSNNVTADYTSIGAHTAMWDFDTMAYHPWLSSEAIELLEPKPGKKATFAMVNGQEVAIGSGLHDSSSSIIPLLEMQNHSPGEFILLSTGTWIICMNPFSKETLTADQLKNDCLCFMTPHKKQIKSSMQFLGKVHEVNAIELGTYFGVDKNHFLEIPLNKALCLTIFNSSKHVFFPREIPADFKGNMDQLHPCRDYETAYYQLVFEIAYRVCQGVQRILDDNHKLKDIYISGGFNKNTIFVEFLTLMLPDQTIKFPQGKHASALGAAMLMKDYL